MKTLLELMAAVMAVGGLYVVNAAPQNPTARAPQQTKLLTHDCRTGMSALVSAGAALLLANDRCSEKERLVRQQHGPR